eukprot:gene25378-64233_t
MVFEPPPPGGAPPPPTVQHLHEARSRRVTASLQAALAELRLDGYAAALAGAGVWTHADLARVTEADLPPDMPLGVRRRLALHAMAARDAGVRGGDSGEGGMPTRPSAGVGHTAVSCTGHGPARHAPNEIVVTLRRQ